MENMYYPFINSPLKYDYNALEPYIDAQTLHLHHDRHLQKYIDNLNAVLFRYPPLKEKSLTELLRINPRVPSDVRRDIRVNAGGVYNHRLYFDGMAEQKKHKEDGILINMLETQFGSMRSFKKVFTDNASSIVGSGYVFLCVESGRLKIERYPNQESPVSFNRCPILTCDVWEHSYYLKHYNDRAGYVSDWFSVVDYEEADERLLYCFEK